MSKLGKYFVIGATGIIGLAWIGGVIDEKRRAVEAAEQAAASAQRVAKGKQERLEKCRAELGQMTASYEDLYKQRRYFEAAGVLRDCADRTNEPAMKQAVRSAEIADLLVTIEDKQQSPRQRLKVMDKLRDDYPEAFKDRTALHAELIRLVTAQEAAEQRKEAVEKKKKGVSIGMSQEDVLASSWGKPRKINRSTYAWGTREQWVYDGGYLYFTNGVLDAIQN